jgi:hypothetical protein
MSILINHIKPWAGMSQAHTQAYTPVYLPLYTVQFPPPLEVVLESDPMIWQNQAIVAHVVSGLVALYVPS